MPRYALQGFFFAATIVNVAAAYGIATHQAVGALGIARRQLPPDRRRRRRDAAPAQRLSGARQPGRRAVQGIPAVPVRAGGLIVVLVALQLLAERPTAPHAAAPASRSAGSSPPPPACGSSIMADPTGMLVEDRRQPDPAAHARLPRGHHRRRARLQGDVVTPGRAPLRHVACRRGGVERPGLPLAEPDRLLDLLRLPAAVLAVGQLLRLEDDQYRQRVHRHRQLHAGTVARHLELPTGQVPVPRSSSPATRC